VQKSFLPAMHHLVTLATYKVSLLVAELPGRLAERAFPLGIYHLRRSDGAQKKKVLPPPIHPGETLREEYLKPLGLSMNKLALDLRVPITRISEIVHERRGITTDTALRLARYFNTSARFWLNLQAAYDLEVAEDESSGRIEQEVLPAVRREFSLP
jgi:addiction module HigA family antidote